MHVQETKSDKRFEQVLNAITAAHVTQVELEVSVSPNENERLLRRLKAQNEAVRNLSKPLAWDW